MCVWKLVHHQAALGGSHASSTHARAGARGFVVTCTGPTTSVDVDDAERCCLPAIVSWLHTESCALYAAFLITVFPGSARQAPALGSGHEHSSRASLTRCLTFINEVVSLGSWGSC